jgi:hypothetical protein
MSLSKWEKNRRRNEMTSRQVAPADESGSRRLAGVVNNRWDSAYSVPDWSIVDRWFLPSRCLMLVWISDEPFWRLL